MMELSFAHRLPDVCRERPNSVDAARARRRAALQLDLQTDPLEFWKVVQNVDQVVTLARLVHCVPASSAPSERVFSSAGFFGEQKAARATGSGQGRSVHDHSRRYERENKGGRAEMVGRTDSGSFRAIARKE